MNAESSSPDAAATSARTAEPLFGGSGQRFDWQVLDSLEFPMTFGIAGGITVDDVSTLKRYNPSLIDVCTGVEVSPGIKDHALVERLWLEIGS